jgi:hypothetical protein
VFIRAPLYFYRKELNMTFTLSNCIERINQALDYPAVSYTDISHYFDQAISELNTTLRIGIKPISQLLAENRFSLSDKSNVISFQGIPTDIPVLASLEEVNEETYFYNAGDRKFYKLIGEEYLSFNDLYAVATFPDYTRKVYKAFLYSANSAAWGEFETDDESNLDLTDYLPADIIILFIIPYVCYKFTIRDGGNGALFREEFAQGFQQIQTSYDIPNTVRLATVAHKKAYTADVNENLDNLNVTIPLRAIYDSMKIGNAIMPEYGGFYESGGWGL